MNLPDLITKFSDAHSQQEEVSLDDPEQIQHNKLEIEAFQAAKKILEFGDNGKKALLELLNHSSRKVRISAAALSLSYSPERCENTLSFEATRGGIDGFRAEKILERWKNEGWHAQP